MCGIRQCSGGGIWCTPSECHVPKSSLLVQDIFTAYTNFSFLNYSSDIIINAGVLILFKIHQSDNMANQLRYQNLEDQDDSSITEVEDSLMGDEKQMNRDEYGRRYRTKSKKISCLTILKEARFFLDTILLLAIVGLLLRRQSQEVIPTTSERDVGGDMTGVGPHRTFTNLTRTWLLADNQLVPTQITTFHINQTFAPYNTTEFFREEVLTAWNEILPGMGICSMHTIRDWIRH